MASHIKNLMILICLSVFFLTAISFSHAGSGSSQPGPTPPPKFLPDLTPISLYFDKQCNLKVKIKNAGLGGISRRVNFRYFMNDQLIGGGGFNLFLKSGMTVTKLVCNAPLLGVWVTETKEWRFEIDPEDLMGMNYPLVEESDEENNSITVNTWCLHKDAKKIKDSLKIILLPLPFPTGKAVLSGDKAIPLKFRHHASRKDFSYEFEKWDEKGNRWIKTREPRMIRSHTSQGSNMVMTTAYIQIKTPGKYRWGIAGVSPQQRQIILVGEVKAKRIASKKKALVEKGKGAKPGTPAQQKGQQIKDLSSIPTVKKPNIWFDLSTKPAPRPKLNEAFNLVIGARNLGTAPNGNSPSNKVVVRLSCEALDGGHCEKLLGDPVVSPIDPGKRKTLNYRSVFKATEPGKYRVSMKLDPVPKSPGSLLRIKGLKKEYSFDFTILALKKPEMKSIKQPKKITTPGRMKVKKK